MTTPAEWLDETTIGTDPIEEFRKWHAAAAAAGVPYHDAMALATVSTDGHPSARMVLLKKVDSSGFVFYTNFRSRKGRELERNPHAALLFFWPSLNRSIRIEGEVRKVSDEESETYFATRPRAGQLSAVTSSQSEPIGSRAELDRRFEESGKRFEGLPVARPAHWGGFRLVPVRIEFWQERFSRLNDRVEFTRQGDGAWKKQRLQP